MTTKPFCRERVDNCVKNEYLCLIAKSHLMNSFFSRLNNFQGSTDETELYKEFYDLAPAFLYGGHINVRDEYKIYIRTVEFYFHSETAVGVHDPIVYHRNGKNMDENIDVPYFPIMTLHAHNSGFDITFEREGQYRASALIRAYEVVGKDGKYLKWNSSKGRFERSEKYCFNTQSTYLYILLNGFSLVGNSKVEWVPAWREQKTDLFIKSRQGVFKSKSETEYIVPKEPKLKEKCDRQWSFTRLDEI